MWCLGEFPDIVGQTHPYIESVPGCWKTYTDVLAREYEQYEQLGDIHQMAVDTYAVQHPGKPSQKQTQSVWRHLISLYYQIEKGADAATGRQKIEHFITQKPSVEWLKPPSFTGTLTIADIAQARTIPEHKRMVRHWAQSVWDIWYTAYENQINQLL